MSRDNNETRRIRTSDLIRKTKSRKRRNSKSENGEGKKKNNFKNKHPKAVKIIKWTIISLIGLMIIGAGILVGAFIGIFGDELKIDPASLVVGHENSIVYDADGNQIAILSGGTKRKSISMADMSEYLPKAYVAIEDERFYKHRGVDILRTVRATLTYVIHRGNSKFGGSTITQQVIKNITQDKDRSSFAGALRKVKEISKAFQVDNYLSKDQILELYLNLIFVGGDDINGVELGSIYYFNKSAKDLSIAECAYLAGINHSPNMYKPFSDFSDKENPEEAKQKNNDLIKKRTKTVLGKMKELKYITKEQYDEAVAEVENGLKFEKGESASVSTDVSYLTAAAIDQILDQIISENNEDMNRDAAEMYLYSGGYKIYTTQKTDIQNILETEIKDDKWFTSAKYKDKKTGEMVRETSIPSMVIIDHHTGQVVAAASATGEKEARSPITKLGYLNYPTKIDKQTGSCMKPISVIAPGLITGTITGATVYNDVLTDFGGGFKPKDYDYCRGLQNMRAAIEHSENIPHVKALSNIGIEASVEFCKSVGLPDFTESGLSLALGGIQYGVSPYEMAGAYAAIANKGEYITPTFYTKVTDQNGNIIYEPKQEKTRVMSEQLAYIETNILQQVTATGTATYCKMPGIDTAAKTGTTNDDYDRWLCGYTPYYTAAAWYGYEFNAEVHYSGNPAGKLWAAVMKSVHEHLENKTFDEPEGIIRRSVCKLSGKLATDACAGNTYTEVFTKENVPTAYCEGHTVVRICNETHLLATDFCPAENVTEKTIGGIPEKEIDAKWRTINQEEAIETIPTESCNIHIGPPAPPEPTPEEKEKENHKHVWDKGTVTKEPTHKAEGEKTYKCECGKTKTEAIPKVAHTYGDWEILKEPTATEPGKKKRFCLVCAEEDFEEIPATGGGGQDTNTVTNETTDDNNNTNTNNAT